MLLASTPRRKYTMHELHVIKQKMDFEKYQEIMERRHLKKKKKLVKYKPMVVPHNSPDIKAEKPMLPVPEFVVIFEDFKS
jgi:hypothetical protein